MENVMMNETADTSTKFAFTYDHVAKTIVGCDYNFKRAGIPGSDQEKELMKRINDHPDYSFQVVKPKKQVEKKLTYAGLTKDFIEKYLEIQKGELAEEMRTQFAKMKEDKVRFPTIRSWFLDLFPKFNVEKAKREISAVNLTKAKAPYKVIKVSLSGAKVANQ